VDYQGIGVQFPAGARDFFFSSTVTQYHFIGMTSQHRFMQFRMKIFVSTTVTERLITMQHVCSSLFSAAYVVH
jgi:hypothetical protein